MDETPREEFESQFGAITDEQWQWLKEFTKRNDHVKRISDVVGVNTPDGQFWYAPHLEFVYRS